MITSESFAKLCQNLKHLIFPPRQHVLKDLVGIETQKLVSLVLAEEALPFYKPNEWRLIHNRIDPTTDVAASPKIDSDNRAAKLGVLKMLKDSLSFYVSDAMSYLWGYIAQRIFCPWAK